MSELAIKGRTVEGSPLFLLRLICLTTAMLGTGCAVFQPSIAETTPVLPYISIYLDSADVFRLLTGFAGDIGITHDAALQIGEAICHGKSSAFTERSWTAKPFDDSGSENNIRIGTLTFTCSVK